MYCVWVFLAGKTSRESGNKESVRGVNCGCAQVEPEGLRKELVAYKKQLESLEEMRKERHALELEHDQVCLCCTWCARLPFL